jgi:large subunit ribosomal protein L25
MKKITLKAGSRDGQTAKMVKVELYGPGVANQHLAVAEAELNKAIDEARGATLIDLVVDGGAPIPVLVREIQRSPLKENIVHVDLLAVDMNKPVLVAVELTPVGISKAVTQLGATLVKNLQTLKAECLPGDMVSEIKADISKMDTADDVVRVEDLTMPAGLTVKNSLREVVFSLSASRKGRSEAEIAAETGGSVSEATPAAAVVAPAEGAPVAPEAATADKGDKKEDKKKK